MIKTAQVVKCDYSSDWKAPNGDIISYHQLILSNGDEGSVGLKQKLPPEIAVGATITYTKNEKNQIKLERNVSPSSFASPGASNKKKYTTKKRNETEYLGYCMGYAKDMVIAGKAKPANIKEFKYAATEIYSILQELLNDDSATMNEDNE